MVTLYVPYLISVVKLVALYVDLLFVHMVVFVLELDHVLALATVVALTTVEAQTKEFLTNIFCFDIEPLVRLDWDKRLFSVEWSDKVTLCLFFK